MPPSNTSFATATVISSLPYDFTQTDINDAGVNYTVYYKLTAPALSRVIGAWGFSGNTGGAVYRPVIRPYLGPAGAPTQVLGIGATNRPIQFPVTALSDYFLEFTKNVDDAVANTLRVRVEVAPLDTLENGDILVNDDSTGFPMWVGPSDVDNETRNFVNDIVNGEAGDIIPVPNVLCLESGSANTVVLYNTTTFAIIYTTAALGGTVRIRSNADRVLFYVGRTSGVQAYYRTITSAGVESGEVTLTGLAHMQSLCADANNLILYVAPNGSSVAIKRWDIVNAVFLTDLVASIANYQIPDILVLDDTTIVALYYATATRDIIAKRYSIAGTVLNTYSLGIQTDTVKPRMAWALDNPTSFWVMSHDNGISKFRNVNCSDGSILTTRLQREYETGVYNASETATPDTRFGSSFSCPFMIYSTNTLSGIYFIDPTVSHDIYNGSITKKIPDPTIRTALFGE